MKKKFLAISAIAVTMFSCSEQDVYEFEIPDGYVAPTHYTDDNGETYITSAAISTATGEVDSYEYVDLGLSVKWARVNLGASSPEEFGDYYAWGETETKNEYTEDNSVTYGDANIDDFSGSKKYDAATANWGNAWRMPTQAEFQELIDNCETIEYLKYNDVYGYLITIDDDKSLFFPEAGYISGTSSYSNCLYWTSTPSGSSNAYKFGMTSSSSTRSIGGSIRAVTDGDSTDKSIEDILDEAPEQLYLVGLNDDWDSYDIKLTPSNEDEEYVYQGIATVTSCSSGYVVYVEEDNDFLTFSSDTGKDDSALVYQGSENIPFNNTGIYIWTVDLANFTYSYTEVTTVSYSGLNNDDTLIEMTQDSDDPYTYTAEIEITTASTDGIKIVLNGNSEYYLGGDSGNLEFLSTITDDADIEKGNYLLTVDFATMTYSLEFIDLYNMAATGTANGYEYVDLGLTSGLKWARINLGASSPEEYGDYYAWGEIETKSSYTSSNSTTYNVEMEDYTGNPTYDAAAANWEDRWRTPTEDDFIELYDECEWTWMTYNDIDGYLVTGPNGNSIFLPAGGLISGYTDKNIGEYGRYWSSTPYSGDDKRRYHLCFYEGSINAQIYYSGFVGMTIRAVYDENYLWEAPTTGTLNGYEWVDLGLPSGLKWATVNVGADEPTDYGNYYAWGEIEPKDGYYTSNSVTYGKSSSDFSGDATYDAATANWGSDWRMPTKDECQELIDKCTWTSTTQANSDGEKIRGYLIEGTNGNTIFLPFTGYYSGTGFASGCNYWSSTPKSLIYAYNLKTYLSAENKCQGRAVRPVTD